MLVTNAKVYEEGVAADLREEIGSHEVRPLPSSVRTSMHHLPWMEDLRFDMFDRYKKENQEVMLILIWRQIGFTTVKGLYESVE